MRDLLLGLEDDHALAPLRDAYKDIESMGLNAPIEFVRNNSNSRSSPTIFYYSGRHLFYTDDVCSHKYAYLNESTMELRILGDFENLAVDFVIASFEKLKNNLEIT